MIFSKKMTLILLKAGIRAISCVVKCLPVDKPIFQIKLPHQHQTQTVNYKVLHRIHLLLAIAHAFQFQ